MSTADYFILLFNRAHNRALITIFILMSTADEFFYDIDIDLNHFSQLYPSSQSSRENRYFDNYKFNVFL